MVVSGRRAAEGYFSEEVVKVLPKEAREEQTLDGGY